VYEAPEYESLWALGPENNIADYHNTILIPGYQAAHTLGRRLVVPGLAPFLANAPFRSVLAVVLAALIVALALPFSAHDVEEHRGPERIHR